MLTRQELERFQRDGFLGPYTIAEPDEMDSIRSRLEADIENESRDETIASQVTPITDDGRPLRTLYDRHLTDPTVRRLATDPGIVERAKQLLSEELLLWRSTFWIKQPLARRLEWHQDTYKDEGFGSFPNVNAWIAIDVATAENGVRLVPGNQQ